MPASLRPRVARSSPRSCVSAYIYFTIAIRVSNLTINRINKKARADGGPLVSRCEEERGYSSFENSKYRLPEMIIAAGRVSTQARAMLRIVDHCSPHPLAAMVPAMPENTTSVHETTIQHPSAPELDAAHMISLHDTYY